MGVPWVPEQPRTDMTWSKLWNLIVSEDILLFLAEGWLYISPNTWYSTLNTIVHTYSHMFTLQNPIILVGSLAKTNPPWLLWCTRRVFKIAHFLNHPMNTWKPIKVFGWLSGIEESLISYADAINETGDILDIYMTVIKSVLSSRAT